MSNFKNLCFFCGGKKNIDPAYYKLANECGVLIAKNKYNLIYGGGKFGLMGEIATAVIQSGGYVISIYPTSLKDIEPLNQAVHKTIIVDSLFDRKKQMLKRSDAFIILPGGLGTLDELFEVITLKNIQKFNKPIIIVNYQDYWQDLLKLLDKIIEKKFACSTVNDSIFLCQEPEEIFLHLNQFFLKNIS